VRAAGDDVGTVVVGLAQELLGVRELRRDVDPLSSRSSETGTSTLSSAITARTAAPR
jgi:hypothetical protein